MIGPDGLVYKFFQDLQTKPKQPSGLCIYVLSYNLPKQFQLWIDNFKSVFPKEFDTRIHLKSTILYAKNTDLNS